MRGDDIAAERAAEDAEGNGGRGTGMGADEW
jgi:hypothetical protein